MSLRNIILDTEYRNLHKSIVQDFFIPLLSNAICYKRSVGFFSSTALVCFSYGLCRFLKNGGKIQLVISPKLSDEDVLAMKAGYDERLKIVESALVQSLENPVSVFEEKRLNMLANLIATQKMDIKVALTESGMYHEKLGIIEDSSGDYVAFSGSLNESKTAFEYNYEAIDVYKSWTEDFRRAEKKKLAFENIWSGKDVNLRVFDFPQLKTEFIKRYKKDDEIDYDLDDEELNCAEDVKKQENEKKIKGPFLPKEPDFGFYDYQSEAIDVWEKNNFVGIFDMATGTGKTLTGLGALTRCSERNNHKIAAVIVAPYQHLVEQWVEDVVRFGITPIVAYSSSSQTDWKNRLKKAVRDQKLFPNEKSFLCVVTTNATFKSAYLQEQIAKISCKKLLIVDEAHNAGACSFKNVLDAKYDFRLALSATLDRHNDDEGTNFLHDYFGKVCLSYGLERAIDEKKLTPYKYFPIVVYLTEQELEDYRQISEELHKHVKIDSLGRKKLDPRGELLAIERSRIIAGAQNKLDAFRNKIELYKEKTNILVYCGATTVLPESDEDEYKYDFDKTESGERQIVAVTKILGKEMGMTVSRFTSEEDIETRKIITEKFKDEQLQAIVAIKCLDEGVNIPSIKTAFILASTTNPKEYIQRRGRVLRKWPGKKYAEIFDFITLPRRLETVPNLTKEEVNCDLSLVKNELRRIKEFASIANNGIESVDLMDQIQSIYDIADKDFVEDKEI